MRSTAIKLGLAALALAIVAGCQPKKKPQPRTAAWAKESVSKDQLRADFGLCGGSFDEAGNFKYAEENLATIDKCMADKGYKRTR